MRGKAFPLRDTLDALRPPLPRHPLLLGEIPPSPLTPVTEQPLKTAAVFQT